MRYLGEGNREMSLFCGVNVVNLNKYLFNGDHIGFRN